MFYLLYIWFSLDGEGDAMDSKHIFPFYGDALGIACPGQFEEIFPPIGISLWVGLVLFSRSLRPSVEVVSSRFEFNLNLGEFAERGGKGLVTVCIEVWAQYSVAVAGCQGHTVLSICATIKIHGAPSYDGRASLSHLHCALVELACGEAHGARLRIGISVAAHGGLDG